MSRWTRTGAWELPFAPPRRRPPKPDDSDLPPRHPPPRKPRTWKRKVPPVNKLTAVVYERPRCPRCRGIRLRKVRTRRDRGDGTAEWWVWCRNESCRHRFRILFI